MIMTLMIRKVLLTEQHNSSYFINFPKFISAELSDEQQSAMFAVLQAGERFEERQRSLVTRTESNNVRLHIANENSVVGYSSLALVDMAYYNDVILGRTNYTDLIAKTQIFCESIGWQMQSLKHIEYEVGSYTYNTTDFHLTNYSLYPMLFNQIEELYNNASLV